LIRFDADGAPVRAEVKALDPDLLVFDIRTMHQVFEGFGLLALRIAAQTTGAMGLIALALSALGLYAVMAFMVSRRTREIGIRMALGATSGEVQCEVLRAGLKSTALGIALGVPGAFVVSHFYVSGITTYVNPADPAIFIGAPVVVAIVAICRLLGAGAQSLEGRPGDHFALRIAVRVNVRSRSCQAIISDVMLSDAPPNSSVRIAMSHAGRCRYSHGKSSECRP